jgi:hypothetical protein
MVSKSGRPSIEVLAALLCPIAASAQENHGTPAQRSACAPGDSYMPDPVRVENCLRQRMPISAMRADRSFSKVPMKQ